MVEKPNIYFGDYHWFLFRYIEQKFYSAHNFELFKLLRDKSTEDIVKFYIDSCKFKSPLTLLESLRFLNNLKISIENKASEIISKRCIYYWIHLYRRIGLGKIFGNESDTTLALYRNMVECCIQKFGRINCGLEIIYGNESYDIKAKDIASGNYLEALKFFSLTKHEINNDDIYLGNFNEIDYTNIYIVERLMFEYWHLTTCLRRLYKGGKLLINDNYNVICNNNTEFLMKSYDERNDRYGNFNTTQGIDLGFNELELLNSGCVLIPQYNYKQVAIQDYPFNKFFNLSNISIDPTNNEPFKPNFLWFPFDFDNYFISNSFLKDEFFEYFQYSLESFVTTIFLLVFRNLHISINNKQYAFYLIQKGYTAIISEDELINDLVEYSKVVKLPSLSKFELNIDETKKIINDIKLNNENKKKINISTLGPRKIILPSIDNKYIIDLSGILDLISKQTHFLPERNIGKKGSIFEDNIIKKIKKENLNIWESKKKLNGFDLTSKEIDVSFYDRNVLFICELKCIKRSLSYITGDFKSLKYRKDKFTEALTEVDNKADWILNHRKGHNFKLPDVVDIIVPIVISPFIEYIWDIDDKYWINSKTPRICVIKELFKFLKDNYINSIIVKPFIKIP